VQDITWRVLKRASLPLLIGDGPSRMPGQSHETDERKISQC
jgi:hypothetical protein